MSLHTPGALQGELEGQHRDALLQLLKVTETAHGAIPTYASHSHVPLSDLESEIERLVNEPTLKKLKAVFLSIKKNGLTYREACMIQRCDPDIYQDLAQEVPAIAKLVEISMLEFKEKLLNVLSNKAILENDDKLAQYLLEKRFEQEFDNSMKKLAARKDTGHDPVTTALIFIQQADKQAIVDASAAEPDFEVDAEDAEILEGKSVLDSI